jgi:hypothetical protein
MANPASFDFDQNLAGVGLRRLLGDQLKVSPG